MAFVVEDGSIVVDANSYASVAAADSYHSDRGNVAWGSLDTTGKQQALVKATDYIDQRFGGRFLGYRIELNQSLSWPRVCTIYERDEIPIKLKYAAFEYALRASAKPLAPDILISDSGVVMMTTRMKAGPVEQAFAPSGGSSLASTVYLLRPYPAADMYLRDLVAPGGNQVIR